jgi:AGZA family xanthine/uracil permease-like MFS transporter
MDGALGTAGTSAAAIGAEKLGALGVLYHGLEALGGGSILAGLVLGAIGALVIERKFAALVQFPKVASVEAAPPAEAVTNPAERGTSVEPET